MPQYLMIENPGVAQLECFTVLGVSTTRYCDDSRTIGQFGTGSKQAVALLLRRHLPPVIYLGKQRLAFSTESRTISDGITAHDYGQIVCHVSGKGKARTIPLGFVVEHGVHDWTEASMALREFLANALDRSIRECGSYNEACVRVVYFDDEPTQSGGKDGYTRVYVPMSPDVETFHAQVGKRFMHYSSPELLDARVLPKANRATTEGYRGPVIFKRGVFVREIRTNKSSLFDYNFGPEFKLDECRNASDYDAKCAAGAAIARASVSTLVRFLTATKEHALTPADSAPWELELDPYCLQIYGVPTAEREALAANWRRAWAIVAGDAEAVAGHGISELDQMIEATGHKPVAMNAKFHDLLRGWGIKTTADALGDDAAKGRLTFEATQDVLNVRDELWVILERFGMTEGKEKPPARCFNNVMQAGAQMLGYYEDGTVFINADVATGKCHSLYKVMLEELGHYVTGARDGSRDFQDFAFRFAAGFLSPPPSASQAGDSSLLAA